MTAQALLLKEADASKLLAISERTLRKERQAGRLPYIMIRGAIRYSMEDLQAYIQEARKCHSTKERVPRTGTTRFKSTVSDFEAALARRRNGKPPR